MTDIGYTLSSEEHSPTDLVEQASTAEAAGFDFLSISDHYHPWTTAQGHSPFVWSTLGGVSAATESIDVGVGVSAPIQRIHPAIYAQAAATTAAMFDGRQFYAGVGTGENLNEHVVGEHWPEHAVRLEMLEEAVEVVDALWTGEEVSHYGEHYTVENAQLFTLPAERPPICVSAYGERAARAAAEFGDGSGRSGPRTSSRRGRKQAVTGRESASYRPASRKRRPRPSRRPTSSGRSRASKGNSTRSYRHQDTSSRRPRWFRERTSPRVRS
nr:TIGR03557 family F420-dependent LLM class oxidoreductase [Salinarchaeum sp. Harcht-Bsk1]